MARVIDPSDWLLDLIYDAASDPELWRSVLTEIADRTNSQGGIIFGQSVTASRVYFDYNGRLNEECNQAYQERHMQNPWSIAMETRPVGEVVMSEEIIPIASLRKTAFFDEVLGPQDVAHNAMIPLFKRADFIGAFNLCRSEKQGLFGEAERQLLTELIPHMSRSLTLCFRLDAYRALQKAEFDVLDRLTAGVLLLDRRARVIYTNEAARRHGRDDGVLLFRHASIFARSVSHSRRLGELISKALLGMASGAMSLQKPDGQQLAVIVMSVRGRDIGRFADQGFLDAAVLVYIVDPANRRGVPVGLISDAYGLTHAEARVALAAAAGFNIPEMSTQLNLSPNTVKTHLRRVFTKTGTHRQAELSRLLGMIALVRSSDANDD